MVRTRAQIHEGKKISLSYRDEQGRESERTIWPIASAITRRCGILAAWCECARIFAVFAPTASSTPIYLDEKYPERRDLLRAKWRRSMVWEAPKETWIPEARLAAAAFRAKGGDGEAGSAMPAESPCQSLRRLLQLFAELAALHAPRTMKRSS